MAEQRSERPGLMDRRQFLALGGAAAAAAALAACTPTGSAPTSAPKASATPGPRSGGSLTWAYAAEIPAIDPAVTVGPGDDLVGNIFDSLVSVDADGNVHPWLATKWTAEND